jgi:hypothetical protein
MCTAVPDDLSSSYQPIFCNKLILFISLLLYFPCIPVWNQCPSAFAKDTSVLMNPTEVLILELFDVSEDLSQLYTLTLWLVYDF